MAGNHGSNAGNGSSPRRRVHITKGYDGVTSATETKVRKISESGGGEYLAGGAKEIYNGLIISVDDSQEWVRGQFAPGRTCYVAQSNAADTDITGSGFLGAFACSGEFVVETPWFAIDGTDAFGLGNFTAGANAGDTYLEDQSLLFTPATTDPNAGLVAQALGTTDDSDFIIGKIVKGVTSLNKVTGSGATTKAIHPAQSNESFALGNTDVIQFKTIQG